MLDKTGNEIKRSRKPRKIFSPTTNSPSLDLQQHEEMSSPSTPPSSSLNVDSPSEPFTGEITEEEIEAMVAELPNNRDGKKFKQFFLLTRKALAKDFARILTDQMSELKAENAALQDKVKKLENQIKNNQIEYQTDINRLEQYGRRSNIEIAGIPDDVPIEKLESKVIEILNEIDVDVNPKEIEACHRLQQNRNSKGPARTIVRFVNRKHCDRIFAKKKT